MEIVFWKHRYCPAFEEANVTELPSPDTYATYHSAIATGHSAILNRAARS